MFARQKRTVASFLLVLAVYLAYHFTLSPIVEPAVELHDGPELTQTQIDAIKSHQTERLNSYQRYFQPGSWEITDKPLVLDNEHSKLLFKEYHNLDNGKVKLFPCAILFLPDGEPEDDAAPRRAIVLEAPEGAILQFDRPVDLQRGKIGQVLGGNMNGPITITAPETRPGANDQLYVVTRDVQMTTEKIWTSQPVDFQFGPNRGSGRDLQIHLSPANGTGRRTTSVGGLESLELLHDVRMRMIPGERGMLPLDSTKNTGKVAVAAPVGAVPGPSKPPQPPVDIRCQGPFRFDLLQYVATFEDQVDVIRSLPEGPSDQMNCDRLSVFFAAKAKIDSTKVDSAKLAGEPTERSADNLGKEPVAVGAQPGVSQKVPNLEPRRIEAKGVPVIVRGGINGVFAQAERLDYDIVTSQLTLDGSQEVALRQNANEIHARSVMYQPGEQGRLGRLSAIGPGWLRGLPPQSNGAKLAGAEAVKPQTMLPAGSPLNQPQNRSVLDLFATTGPFPPTGASAAPPSVFEAHWTKELKMRPHEQNHVISLLGDARAGLSGQGELAADEIHLWLTESPAPETTITGAAAPGNATDAKSPQTASSPHWQIAADRLLAQKGVKINSPQLVGSAERLEGWFEQAPAAPQVPSGSQLRSSMSGLGQIENPLNSLAMAPAPATGLVHSPIAAGVNSIPSRGANVSAPVPPRVQQYSVEGERIRIQFLVRPAGTEVQDVNIDGHTRFAEMQTAQPGDQPLTITGDRLQVTRANFPDTQATVVGQPALVGARGMEMYGDTVRMDKAANRVWIDGPGRMKVPNGPAVSGPLSSGPPSSASKPIAQLKGASLLDPRAVARGAMSDSPPSEYAAPGQGAASVLHAAPQAPEPMNITWQGRMNFDGATARFEKTVVGKSLERNFTTETLEVTLRRRIDFNQPHLDNRAEVGRFVCRGETQLENRTSDCAGLNAVDRMRLRDLMVDEVSGAILGQGPGWLVSVRKGSPDPNAPAGAKATSGGIAVHPTGWQGGSAPTKVHPAATRKPADGKASPDAVAKKGAGHKKKSRGVSDLDEPLNYLHVQYQGALSGNLNNHEITFHDRVRTIYGPVLSWQDELDLDSVDDLGPGDVQMTCDQLTVHDSADPQPAPQKGRRPIEMEAVGNTVVDVQAFTARCYRMTYSEAKDLLTFDGDGRNDAQLFRQEHAGAPSSKTAARTIQFWRTANRIRVDGARVIDLNQIPSNDD